MKPTTTWKSLYIMCEKLRMFSMRSLVQICVLLTIIGLGSALAQRRNPCAVYRQCVLVNGNSETCANALSIYRRWLFYQSMCLSRTSDELTSN
ncbi:hypothetical protein P879_09362 [Paragonimus westermani]|uniref:Uncharacterized protein n=1 Tax=Paragonimus westermani TaxID=34504 RepID=A0A8T0DQP2_9TREM|nr:hypothetical protein P879_09362 [Paragonimus westermani]